MARSFNGSTDKIANTNSVTYLTGGTPGTLFSISCWAYPLSTSAGSHELFIVGPPPGYTAQLRRDTSDWNFYVNTGSNVNVNDPGAVSINTWTHLCGTYDGANVRLYVNGSLLTPVAATTLVAGSANAWGIGSDVPIGGGGSYWDGSIADVAIWTGSNAVLSNGEAKALSLGARPFTIRPSSLAGYWPLTGLQSPEPDLTGTANNGTLTGTANASGPPVMQFTPRWPLNSPFNTAQSSSTGTSFQPAWVMRNRIVVDGIGI